MIISNVAVTSAIIIGRIISFMGCALSIYLLSIVIAVFFIEVDESGDAVIGAVGAGVFLLVGIGLIIKGYRMDQQVKRFRKYVSLISLDNVSDLDIIAQSTSAPIDFVMNDLEQMIDKQFFINVMIDRHSKQILISNREKQVI